MKVLKKWYLVRRDALTINPVLLAPYEVVVEQSIFGAENVYLDKEKSGQVAESEIEDAQSEADRVRARFGQEPVTKVYGERVDTRLGDAIQNVAEKAGHVPYPYPEPEGPPPPGKGKKDK